MRKFRNWLIFFMALSFTNIALANPNLINSAREKMTAAFSQHSFHFSARIDTHKSMIASYIIQPGDCALDIGAYVGEYSIYYRELVKNNGLVIAYEANPYVFAALKNCIRHLPFFNIDIRHKAASDTTGKKISMKLLPNALDAASTVEPALMGEWRMPGNTVLVDVETECLDELLKRSSLPHVSIIKIDVEGHEHAVLKGAGQLLRSHRPVVIFEYGFAPGSWEPATIQQMEAFGYVCYDLNTDQRVYPCYISTSPTDLVGIPQEMANEIVPLLPYLY